VGAVTYDSRNPLERTLKSFAIDLTTNPTMGQLLNQVRGEKVEITTQTAGPLTGMIVGVEKTTVPGDKGPQPAEQVNLLTADGLQGVVLAQVKRVRFIKLELESEFRQALEALAAGRDRQKKMVRLQFTGNAKRPVRVGYVTESPVWKTTYRLVLPTDAKKGPYLQGWAVVENTTDEDWTNVRLGLVSGRPISFRMDLYEPLFAPRPLVQPELFAGLRPQMYGGDLSGQGLGGGGGGGGAGNGEKREEAQKQMDQLKKEMRPARNTGKGGRARMEEVEVELLDTDLDPTKIASAAATIQLGDTFQYAIEEPVNLPRQKSALLPIVTETIRGERVSIYNPRVQEKHPLLGLRLTNSSKLHLMQGPITVFDGPNYAGDARLPDVKPSESRLLSYAIDLGTEVVVSEPQQAEELLSVRVAKGLLHATRKVRSQQTYVVKNRSETPRQVLIEHALNREWKLVAPAKADETTRDLYRFALTAKPNEPVELKVIEESPTTDNYQLSENLDDLVRLFLKATPVSARVKATLEKAVQMRAAITDATAAIAKEQEALKVIADDQKRMRDNMERVPPTSEAYKRYLKKFDEQETEIEKLRASITTLSKEAEQRKRAFTDYVQNVQVD
jgi:hypothetical protein